jgi:hypothetical protein
MSEKKPGAFCEEAGKWREGAPGEVLTMLLNTVGDMDRMEMSNVAFR